VISNRYKCLLSQYVNKEQQKQSTSIILKNTVGNITYNDAFTAKPGKSATKCPQGRYSAKVASLRYSLRATNVKHYVTKNGASELSFKMEEDIVNHKN
jgi:hypothetical protein